MPGFKDFDPNEIQFEKFIGRQELDRKGRVKFDADGNKIDKDKRRSKRAVRNNPHALTAGTVFDSSVDFFDDIVAKGKRPIGRGVTTDLDEGLAKRAGLK